MDDRFDHNLTDNNVERQFASEAAMHNVLAHLFQELAVASASLTHVLASRSSLEVLLGLQTHSTMSHSELKVMMSTVQMFPAPSCGTAGCHAFQPGS